MSGETKETSAIDEPSVMANSPFSMDGVGKPSVGGGKFTMPTPLDETKRMSAGIPFPILYACLGLFVVGAVVTGDPNAPHGFRMP